MPTVTLESTPLKTKPPKKVKPACIKCGIPLCEFCGVCETSGCTLFEESITSAEVLALYPHLRSETQKARGFISLAKKYRVPNPYHIIIDESDIERIDPTKFFRHSNVFVRPCPRRPRHGFVESRSVPTSNLKEEALKIFKEARQADEGAELIISPVIAASHNVLFTPTRFSVGRKHDGATSGRGSITIPLTVPPNIDTSLFHRSGIDSSLHDPYIEVVVEDPKKYGTVQSHSIVYITQLRAGTKIPPTIGQDFIPHRMRVEKVIEASGDLLEWEKQTKEITPGTVVTHIGGSLISHYGVHCMENKVPVLTSYVPQIGEVLEPTPKIPDRDPALVLKGLAFGATGIFINTEGISNCTDDQISPDLACLVLMTALHNAAAMTGEDSFWIGVAASLMLRVGMAASHGEARHEGNKGLSREYVYKLAMNNFFDSRTLLGHVQHRFKNHTWPSGFGGKKWADCTESIMVLDRHIRTFLTDPTVDNITPIVNQLNVAVNKAHNGGWWLNKFIGQSHFTGASNQDIYELSLASLGYLIIAEQVRGFDPTPTVDQWKEAPDIEEKYNKWIFASGESEADESDDDNDNSSNLSESGSNYNMQVTEPLPSCTDPNCNTCSSDLPKLENITGKVKIGEVGIEDILVLQCKLNGDTAHVQLALNGYTGYFSCDVPVKTHKGLNEYEHYAPSLSGSGKPYIQLIIYHYGPNIGSAAWSQLNLDMTFSDLISLLNKQVPDE